MRNAIVVRFLEKTVKIEGKRQTSGGAREDVVNNGRLNAQKVLSVSLTLGLYYVPNAFRLPVMSVPWWGTWRAGKIQAAFVTQGSL